MKDLDEIRARLIATHNTEWEYMGESVKMEDNIPTPELEFGRKIHDDFAAEFVANFNEPKVNSSEEAKRGVKILEEIRRRSDEKKDAQPGTFAYDPLVTEPEPEPELTFNYNASDLAVTNEIQPPSTIVINDSDVSPHALVTIHTKTGDVEFGEGYDPSHAAQIFWTAMGNNSPDKLKERIAYLEHQIEALEMDLWSHPNTDVTDAKLTIYNDEEIKQALAYEFTAEDLEEIERRLAVDDTKAVGSRDDGSTSPRLAYEDAMKVI